MMVFPVRPHTNTQNRTEDEVYTYEIRSVKRWTKSVDLSLPNHRLEERFGEAAPDLHVLCWRALDMPLLEWR